MATQRAIAALIVLLATLAATQAFAQHHHHLGSSGQGNSTPYAGQDGRAIKSLSEDDTRQLLAGAGWGFAKPAELSGYPGPRHVLDLADDLRLSASQKSQIQAIFDTMNASARKTGAQFIEAERALSAGFETGGLTPAAMAELVHKAAQLRARLRLIHLQAHLETKPLLTAEQIKRYQMLRGYSGGQSHGNGHGHEKGQGGHHRH